MSPSLELKSAQHIADHISPMTREMCAEYFGSPCLTNAARPALMSKEKGYFFRCILVIIGGVCDENLTLFKQLM